MVKTQIYFSAIVYLLFMGLVGAGLYFADQKNGIGHFMLIGVFCFFGVMLIYSLKVWKVGKSDGAIFLKRFFGLQSVQLNSTDLQNAVGYINWDPDHETERGKILELKTTKGTFRFDSNYYTDFDQLLELVLENRTDLLQEYNQSLFKDRKRSGYYTIIYFVVVIGVLVYMFVRK